jgi:hypothetical protein
LLLLIILRRIRVKIVKVIKVKIIKDRLIIITRSLLSNLSNRGNCLDLFKGFKDINNKRINKRDVYLMVFKSFINFNILKF